MNIEHPDQEFINLEPRPPAEKVPPILPDYPEELKFSSLFSDPDTLGSQWDIQNDDLLTLTLDPREIKAAAANLQWLAFQENLPLEEIAPVADLYRDTYSKEWFGGIVENELQFYDAIALRLKHQEEEEDLYDEEIIENTWRTEHPKLDFALKIVRGVTGTILDTFGARPSDDEPFTQSEGYQRSRSSLSRLAELNPDSFNPAQAIAHDNGEGKLVLNPEGIGGLIGGVVVGAGTNLLGGGPRAFSIRKAADARVFQAKERLKTLIGVTYDPKKKVLYDGNKIIRPEYVSERIKLKMAGLTSTPPPRRKVERYDALTDTYYDRGMIIAGKDIEKYLSQREHHLSIPSPNRTVPQGVTPQQFKEISALLRDKAGHISMDIVIQGSRASGTAKLGSDIDIAIRVPTEEFYLHARKLFNSPNPMTGKERKMLHALETGKIQTGEAKLRELRNQIKTELNLNVDLSILEKDGPFDNGITISLD